MRLKIGSKQVIHLLSGQYSVDSRVRNETEFLIRDYNVNVFCFGPISNREIVERTERNKVKIFSFRRSNYIFGYLVIWLIMLREAKSIKPTLLHCHDINSLVIAYIIAKILGTKIIYDSHELWSQSHHNKRPKIIIGFAKCIERFLATRTDCVVTVSNNIAQYLSRYFSHNNVHVIRNIPTYINNDKCRKLTRTKIRNQWGAKDHHLVVIYQGLIKLERGVFEIAKAFELLPKKKFLLVFLGSGPDEVSLREFVANKGLNDCVIFQKAINQDILSCYTKSADVGVHAIQNSCLNHDYCLPNKLFEYIKCEIPVVVTRLTEMREFVEKNGFGVTFEDGNSKELAKQIQKFSNNKFRESFNSNIRRGVELVSENLEYRKLYKIYEGLIGENYV